MHYATNLSFINPGRLEAECLALAQAGVDAFHVDLCDGRFAPGLGAGFGAIEAARAAGKPVHAHLLIEEPSRHFEALAQSGCASVAVHAEACVHLHRALGAIRDLGMQAAVAVNPATPLTKLTYVLGMVDRVLLLALEAGARGDTAPSVFERVRIVRENVNYLRRDIAIEVEGAMTAPNAARHARFGASAVVLGQAFFDAAQGDYAAGLADFRRETERQKQLV